MGLPNPSYKDFQAEIDAARKGGVPVIASIFASSAEEFAQISRNLDADALELNLSCPHAEKYGSELGRYPDLVESVTGAVKAASSVPVWVKLTPNTADILELGLAAQRGGADAVVAINTLKAMAIDIETGYPILGNRFGGLSGRAIKPVAVRAVYDLASRLEIPVIGVGGISSWEDAVEMIMAGASAIQVGTALLQGYGGEDRLFVIAQSIRSASECLLCCTRQRPAAFVLYLFPGHCIVISFSCFCCMGESIGS